MKTLMITLNNAYFYEQMLCKNEQMLCKIEQKLNIIEYKKIK
jgi:hypothetical protein